MVVELQKLANKFRMRSNESLKDMGLVVKNLKEVPLDEITQYQVLVLKNLVEDKYGEDAKFE